MINVLRQRAINDHLSIKVAKECLYFISNMIETKIQFDPRKKK
jgi:hypothetical protein